MFSVLLSPSSSTAPFAVRDASWRHRQWPLVLVVTGVLAACATPAIAAPAQAAAGASCTHDGQSADAGGLVTDASTAPLPDAEVTLTCGSTTHVVRTGGQGAWNRPLPVGTWVVTAIKPGFTPLTGELVVAVGQDNRVTLALPVAPVTETVTVTAGGFEQAVRLAPASVTVVDRPQLLERRLSTIAEALADVEGVDVGQDVGKTGGLTVSMRGMPSDYTLMLIDGRRQNAAGNVTPNGFTETATSFMPPVGAIERIEVVRGPMSTLYGSDAMGGVVNIITRRVSDRWGGTATLDGTLQSNSDYGRTGQGSLYLTGPVISRRLGVALRGNSYHREAAALKYENVDGTDVPLTSFGLSPTGADIQTAGGRLSFVPGRDHDVTFDADGVWQTYDNSERQLGTLGVQGGYQEQLKFQRQQFVGAYVGRLGFGVIDSSVARNATETIGRTIPPGTPGRVAGDPRALRSTNTIVDAKLVAPLGRHTVSVGGQWWDAHVVDAVAPAPYDHTQRALFAEDEWRLARATSLTAGVRYDHHSTFGGQVSPRAYLVLTPATNWTIKGGVSRGFKTPRLEQLAEGITGFGGQGTIPLLGSPGLQPETSTTTEAGAFYVRGGLSLNVGVFRNDFDNKIASGPGLENCSFRGNPNRPGCVDVGNWPNVDLFGQSINVDEAITQGVEAAARLAIGARVNLMSNYTYTESEQRSGAQAGQPLVNTPRHMFNANVRVSVTDRLGSWVRVEARGSRTRGTSAAAQAARAAIGDFKPYGLVHLGGSYTLTRRITFNATIFNLLNTDFLAYEPYVSNGQTLYASPYNNLQEPLRFWGSVNVSF